MTALHLKTHLETLRDELNGGDEIVGFLDKEKPEDAAEIVQLMAELGSSLTQNVANFMNHWDFTEDCRRASEKPDAAAGGAR